MTVPVSVIIVSWNVCELLAACLDSLGGRAVGDQAAEIIVVDNGSADGSADMVRARFPAAKLIVAADNPGFAAANNLAARSTSGDYLFLLNPDTIVRPGAIRHLATTLSDDPTLGAAGPRLVEADGRTQSSRRRFPSFRTLVYESTPLQDWFGTPGWLRPYYLADTPDTMPTNPDWLVGAAVMVRRNAWDSVDGFDAGFFMYFEETDLFRRLAAGGWRAAYVPAAEVVHYYGKSSEQNIAARQARYARSKIRYTSKHHGAPAAGALALHLRALFAVQLGIEGGKWLLGHRRDLRRQRVAQLAQVVAGRL